MPSGLLIGLLFIPSMIFIYVTLTTFYGAVRAYIGISWLPLGFLLTIWLFTHLLSFQNVSDQWWRDLAGTIRWASLMQVGLGVGLITRAIFRRRGAIGVSLATVLSAVPLVVRFI